MENCKTSDLIIEVKATRKPRFKAGSDLSTKVSRVVVNLHEESMEDHDMVALNVQLFREECSVIPCNEN